MLEAKDSLVLMIDVQERLVGALEKNVIVEKAQKIVDGAKALEIPVLVTEQYPKGLGHTVVTLPDGVEIVEKTYFNALLEEGMLNKIKAYGKKQVIIFGIETHICVYQTACALMEAGFEVYVVKDACASRNKYEFKQGIEAMRDNGAKISCVEMILFEWLKGAKNSKFKEVQALIK